MSFIVKTATTKIIDIKLTDKGRELLTKGFKDVDIFDMVKFSFGDSEIDYRLDIGAGATYITGVTISTPDNLQADFKSRIYAYGSIPSGNSNIQLSSTELYLTAYDNDVINVSTKWPPITDNYIEEYIWENLGPLNDYDFELKVAKNTRSAKINSLDVSGTTQIKIKGLVSGKYSVCTVFIS